MFYIFYLRNDLLTLKISLDRQNNTTNGFFRQNRININGCFRQNPKKKRYYTIMFLALFVKKGTFAYLTLKLSFDLEDDIES